MDKIDKNLEKAAEEIDHLPAETSGDLEVVNNLTEGPIKAVRLPDGRYVTEKLAREAGDLEEEIKRYGEKNMFNIPAFQQVARHFAKWGAEHLKKFKED